MKKHIHAVAGALALATIITFWTSTVASELFGSAAQIAAVNTADIRAITTAHAAALNTAQVAALNTNQVGALETTDLRVFNTANNAAN